MPITEIANSVASQELSARAVGKAFIARKDAVGQHIEARAHFEVLPPLTVVGHWREDVLEAHNPMSQPRDHRGCAELLPQSQSGVRAKKVVVAAR